MDLDPDPDWSNFVDPDPHHWLKYKKRLMSKYIFYLFPYGYMFGVERALPRCFLRF